MTDKRFMTLRSGPFPGLPPPPRRFFFFSLKLFYLCCLVCCSFVHSFLFLFAHSSNSVGRGPEASCKSRPSFANWWLKDPIHCDKALWHDSGAKHTVTMGADRLWVHRQTVSCVSRSPHWLTFTWWGCCGLYLWLEPTELALSFLSCSLLVSVFFFFMALSTVFHSINSPNNSPLSHSVLPVFFCLIRSSNYIPLYESLPQPWFNPF